MRPVPLVATRQFGVFTADQAYAAGWTPAALRHALRKGWVVQVRRGVYTVLVPASGERHADAAAAIRLEAAAVSVANRRVPVSHGGSALLLGMSVARPPEQVCVTFPRGRRDTITGVHRHRGVLRQGDVVRLGGVTMLGPARTVVDLACETGSDDAIVAADSALRLGLSRRDDLRAALRAAEGWPGSRAAALPVLLADGTAESALESLSRLRFATAGLPMPRTQVVIRTAGGRFAGRVDFYWEEFGVVGEADGMGKYAGSAWSLRDEKVRQGVLEDCGLIVVRWGWRELFPFAATEARLRAAFARGVRPDRAARRSLAATLGPAQAL